MGEAAPKVYNIPAGLPFLDLLARGLWRQAGEDPLALSAMTVLLPTRRACRSLADAFLRLTDGRPMVLPRMRPLGEVDEEEMLITAGDAVAGDDALSLPPAIAPLKRQMLLARLIVAWGEHRDQAAISADQAAYLAAELARFLDEVVIEGVGFDGLAELVPSAYAEHWQTILDFLNILREHWPAILAEEGEIDAVDRRNRLLRLQARRWREQPPTAPVIAAGSTGSMPATAELLDAVARLPQGAVVLPGLDEQIDEVLAAAIAADPSHPQYHLTRLINRMGLAHADVAFWPGVADDPARDRARARGALLRETMRPAATTDAWGRLEGLAPGALDGMKRLDCPTPREEAGAIAMMLREVLESPRRTGMLVTPDRTLARRVASELRRWGIDVDDSAGRPLAKTPPGGFLTLLAEMVADGLTPVRLLAALKHPLAAGGEAPARFRAQVRALERAVLRGPRPAPGLEGLRAALATVKTEEEGAALAAWLDRIEEAARPFIDAMARPRVSFAALFDAHLALAEALAASDEEPGAARLWRGEAGEALMLFASELRESAETLGAIEPRSYPGLLAAFMAARPVRPRYGRHPRIAILGPLEARLIAADLVILGGLNEGTWPTDVSPDPWLSRPMRHDFGLPPQERRVGLAAHDFVQGCAQAEVVLTRAQKVEGTPTVPSRWLLRLDTVLEGARADGDDAPAPRLEAGPWLAWLEDLDRPDEARTAAEPPAPCPPLAARPKRLSVTRIEMLMRDPYAVYARYVLGLRKLDPLDADPGAAERGVFIHAALDRFLAGLDGDWPEDALDRLIAAGRAVFAEARVPPGVAAFWWPRFERIARWFVTAEQDRRPSIAESRTEIGGALTIKGPAGPFTLTAKADRIDRRADGSYALIDYKTGSLPTGKEVEAGLSPQLPLEAAMLREGAFEGLPAGEVAEIAYWRLSGREPAGEIKTVGRDPAALAAAALDGLERLVALFQDARTPYHARPRPSAAPRFSDYGHLARVREWSGEGS